MCILSYISTKLNTTAISHFPADEMGFKMTRVFSNTGKQPLHSWNVQ